MSPPPFPLSSIQSTKDVDAKEPLLHRRGKVLAPIMPAPYVKKDRPPEPEKEWSPPSPSSMLPALPTPDSERLLVRLIPNVPEPASVVANLPASVVGHANLAESSINPDQPGANDAGSAVNGSKSAVNGSKSAVNGDSFANGDDLANTEPADTEPANGIGLTNCDACVNPAEYAVNGAASAVHPAISADPAHTSANGDYFAPRCAEGCFCRRCANVPKHTAVFPRPVPRRLLTGRTPPPVLMETARDQREAQREQMLHSRRPQQHLALNRGAKEVIDGAQEAGMIKEKGLGNGDESGELGKTQRLTGEGPIDSADASRNPPTSAASTSSSVQHSASPDPLMLVVQVLASPVLGPKTDAELAHGGLALLVEDAAGNAIDSDEAADAIVAPDAADDDADDSDVTKVVSADNLKDTYDTVEAVSTPEIANVVRTVDASDASNASQAANDVALGTGNAADGVEAAYETEAADTAGVIDVPDAANTMAADFICTAQSYWHQFLQRLYDLHHCALLPAWRALRCIVAETQIMALLAILSCAIYVRPVVRKTFIIASCLQVFLWIVGTFFPLTHKELCSALAWRLIPFSAGLFVVEEFVLGPVVLNAGWAWIDVQWERSRWQADYGAKRAWDEECAQRQEVMRWAQDVVALVACDRL